ncbi:MAG: hypothetical protein ACYS9X_19710 [Planctomycetota bacterium]|jgi:hypothetical protein
MLRPCAVVVEVLLVLAPRVANAELLTFPERPVDPRLSAFRKSIHTLQAKAMKSGKPWTEADLRTRVPRTYLGLEKVYARVRDPRRRALALAQLALVYSELAWVERIEPIRESLAELDEALLARLGHFEESEHFLVRVVGTDPKWGKAALRLAEAARQGYVDIFGFDSISAIPGKKIRILIHVDPAVRAPRLYFHPSPRLHGEMRYEMPDGKYLTLAGRRRIVYGFCHELAHMLAMWGEYRVNEEDRHAWGHYAGCMVVEAVYDSLGNEPWPTWTAYQRRASGVARLRKQTEGRAPGTGSYEAVLSLFRAIGDDFGPEVYGKAWTWLERKRRFRRTNCVRYLWLRDLKEALLDTVPKSKAARVREIFAGT